MEKTEKEILNRIRTKINTLKEECIEKDKYIYKLEKEFKNLKKNFDSLERLFLKKK